MSKYYDKYDNELKNGDCLLFDNGQHYVVIFDSGEVFIQNIQKILPAILLKKIIQNNKAESARRLFNIYKY